MEIQSEHLKEMVIAQNVLTKIRRYASLVNEEFGHPIECYGFLLNPKEINDHVVYNAILASGQVVSHGSAEIDPKGAFESKAEIANMGCSAIGCWHSHHEMGAWHSSDDNANLDKLINSIAANRELSYSSRGVSGNFLNSASTMIIREGELEIEISAKKPIRYLSHYGPEKPEFYYAYTKDGQLFVNIDQKTVLLDVGEHTVTFRNASPEKMKSLGFAYSLVVSGKESYVEVGIKETCNVCSHRDLKKQQIGLKVIELPDDINYTDKELAAEIKRKVKKGGILAFLG